MDDTDNDGRVTVALLFCVTVVCVGNSCLYGYQCALVSHKTALIQEFYNKTYYERRGGVWENMKRYNDYLNDDNITEEEAINKYHVNTSIYVSDDDFGEDFSEDFSEYYGEEFSLGYTKRLHPKHFGADKSLLMDYWEITILLSMTAAAFVLFGMIGAVMSAKVADFFGRKRGMIIVAFLTFIAAILGGIALKVKSPECLMLSRVFAGLHSGLIHMLCPLYLIEISPKKIRGAIAACHQLAFTIGVLVYLIMDLIENESMWPYLYACSAIPSIFCLVLMPFCPESPRFLFIMKKHEENAIKDLIKLRGTDDVSDEIEEMRIEARKSVEVKCCMLREFLSNRELRRPVIIACALQICQQWSGINAVMSYSAMLFEQIDIDKDIIPYIVVGTGAIKVICFIFAIPLIEKAGRRPLLLYPMVGMLLSFIVMMIFLNLQRKDDLVDHHTTFAYFCIIAMYTYIIGFALSLGLVPDIMIGEIFRQGPRASAMRLSFIVNLACSFILGISFPFLKDSMNEFVYILFCIGLAIAVTFIFFFIPETKGKSFDENANCISFTERARGREKAYSINNDEIERINTSDI